MSLHQQSDSRSGTPRAFATTRWSIVVAAGGNSSAGAKQALQVLCQHYWLPLYGYVRRRVADRSEADDLTQAFFAELLEKNYVGSADRHRGKFRSFLLTAFKHFLSKEWDKAKALKRGGGRSTISLDFDLADSRIKIEPSTDLTAEQIYDRQWSVTLLEQIMARLKAEFEQSGRSAQFQCLKPFLVGDHSGRTYAEVGEQLQMSEAAAKMAASRMRKRYRALLRDEIGQTVENADEIDDEIRNLFATLKA